MALIRISYATTGSCAATPKSASTRNSTLAYVSCPAKGGCLAVGNYVDASQASHAMLAYRGPVVAQLQAKAPAHAAGTIRVSVRTANGVSASTSADHYTYDP